MENSELFQLLKNTNDSFFNSASSTMQRTFSYYPLELEAASDALPSHEDKALAALRNHKEAEKRRRERINSHLDKLRTLLPCNSKTDKASLLAKVVERVKELKQQISQITESEAFPSESDEVSVLSTSGDGGGGDGQIVFRASLCCEDRSDLIPDLVEILRSLHLKTLKAEMATLGGRTRNVLLVAADKEHSVESIHFLHNSLKSMLERSNSNDRSKRRRGLDRKVVKLV
ncbi:transcription factor bHLH106 isoform X2 [Cajanus cajan]|uniref:transcription factor bHLH106 isoform X2 n=1 Tax=Cajanus cajan TaxID=3821 RepID=UPI00098D8B8B|nr:transcription factor bHLH106 isoform X2 [Cajanus cajan]